MRVVNARKLFLRPKTKKRDSRIKEEEFVRGEHPTIHLRHFGYVANALTTRLYFLRADSRGHATGELDPHRTMRAYCCSDFLGGSSGKRRSKASD
jgi:hypothetical protein